MFKVGEKAVFVTTVSNSIVTITNKKKGLGRTYEFKYDATGVISYASECELKKIKKEKEEMTWQAINPDLIKDKNFGSNKHIVKFVYGKDGKDCPRLVIGIFEKEDSFSITASQKKSAGNCWYNTNIPKNLIGDVAKLLALYISKSNPKEKKENTEISCNKNSDTKYKIDDIVECNTNYNVFKANVKPNCGNSTKKEKELVTVLCNYFWKNGGKIIGTGSDGLLLIQNLDSKLNEQFYIDSKYVKLKI